MFLIFNDQYSKFKILLVTKETLASSQSTLHDTSNIQTNNGDQSSGEGVGRNERGQKQF